MVLLAALLALAPHFQSPDPAREAASAAFDQSYLPMLSKQAADGSWSGPDGSTLAVTSEALLALLAGGHTARSGAHALHVKSGVTWLSKCFDRATMQIVDPSGEVDAHEAALVLQTMAEVAAFDENVVLRARLKPMADQLLALRDAAGAWPAADGCSTSQVTARALMALVAAREAGLHQPSVGAATGVGKAGAGTATSPAVGAEADEADATVVGAIDAGLRALARAASLDVAAPDAAHIARTLPDTARFALAALASGRKPDKDPRLSRALALLREHAGAWYAGSKERSILDVDWVVTMAKQVGGAAWQTCTRAMRDGVHLRLPAGSSTRTMARCITLTTVPFRYGDFLLGESDGE